MKNPIRNIRQSLSTRLSLWIALMATLIFLLTLSILFFESRKAIRREAIQHASQILNNTAERVNNILSKVVVATNNTDWLINRHLDAPDSMFVYSHRILENNPELNGCSIAFEPYSFKDRGRYFSAYSFHHGDKIETIQEGDDEYEYFYTDWYMLPKLLDHPCWTEPYTDSSVEDIYLPERIISYCKPLKDKNGEYVGTISVDISLDSLSNTISSVKPYPHSYSFVIGQSGTYFVHPDTTKLFYQSIFTETLLQPDSTMSNLGHAMQRGEEGMKQMVFDGEDCYVFYKALSMTGWSVAIVCTESDIFGSYFQLMRIVLGIIIAGLAIMLLVLSRIINKELSPLRQLAHGAETIANGHFDTALPPTTRKDEIGKLTLSFGNMQHSLTKYVEELKKTTASKAQIEGELKIASDIQMSMLPKIFPPYPDRDDIDIFGRLTPAKEVGGDLYDFYIRDEKLFFCIGDVSGKGVPASLVMAVTRAMFRTISTHETRPSRIVSAVNNAMAKDNESNMFVTLFVGVLDLPTGRLRFCNAGHDAPLLISGDGLFIGYLPIDANLPVGVMPDWKFTDQDALIDPFTSIFLYTDGLTEAEDIEHRQFGEDRLLNTGRQAKQNKQDTPKQLIDQMTKAVQDFVGDAEQSDDLTMLAILYSKRKLDARLQMSITLSNNIDEVPLLAEFVNTVCKKINFDMPTTASLNLAIEEAVVNVMSYAYPSGTRGDVNIEAEANDERLKFSITDHGTPFDPTSKREVDTTLSAEDRPIGGLGIHLVRQIMDSVNYERMDGKNVLTLRKKLSGKAPEKAG